MRKPDKSELASIAATGFGFTALCIGDKRGFISHYDARERVLNGLRFLWKKLPNHRGFYYHWANIDTGQRLWDSEVSSVDTAILLCGILTCHEHFENTEIRELTRQIFERVEWDWLSEDTPLLPHGWTPESGFLQYRWNDYGEMMMMYLLGLGSTPRCEPTHGMLGSARSSNTMAFGTSDPSRLSLSISIRRHGLISGTNAITTPIISRTRSSPQTSIAVLSRPGKAVPRLLHCQPLGNNSLRTRQRLCRVGWSAADGTD